MNAVTLYIEPREKDLGGFSVKRILPSAKQRMVGPWIFFDHAGPAEFSAGEGVDVRPHPHIGLATVTYLFEGELLHKDSVGSVQAIKPGDINLMTAGRGIVHSERTDKTYRQKAHRLHALQLWLALPDEKQECAPSFEHTPALNIPRIEYDDVTIRVMMGNAHGASSPVTQHSPTIYCEYMCKNDATFTLPEAEERALYIMQGSAKFGDEILSSGIMYILNDNAMMISASKGTHFIIIGGSKVGERFIEWNFVSHSKERIEQAKEDWQSQRFTSVPDESDFIPLP